MAKLEYFNQLKDNKIEYIEYFETELNIKYVNYSNILFSILFSILMTTFICINKGYNAIVMSNLIILIPTMIIYLSHKFKSYKLKYAQKEFQTEYETYMKYIKELK